MTQALVSADTLNGAGQRAGGDGQSRYVMLETLRAYGAGLLAQAGEREQAAAALAGYMLGVTEQAAAGLETGSGEVAAARRLDAEDATMWQVLAWAVDHDADVAARLAAALAQWCLLRGRRSAVEPLLREAAGRAAPGSDPWYVAQLRLGDTASRRGDPAGALGHYTAVIDAVHDRGPSRVLADGLAGRSLILSDTGRLAEAADDGHRSLAVARELGDPAAQATALATLSAAVLGAGDLDGAVRLARQAVQVPGDIGGWVARMRGFILVVALEAAGDLAAAGQACAEELARSQDTGDLKFQADLLIRMAMLDLPAGRFQDAAAHLREALQIAVRAGMPGIVGDALHGCGHLCAATGRPAEAVTVWAAEAAFARQHGFTAVPRDARRRQEVLSGVRRVLGPARTRAAEQRGAAMSLAAAAEYALLLAAPVVPGPGSPPGPGRLSARERELVILVARGRTDAQIAAELYISVRTVHTHLDRIREKTGCRRRADLTRLALQAGLV